MGDTIVDGIEVSGPIEGRARNVFPPEALRFLRELHRKFGPVRRELLDQRAERRARIDRGESLDFLPETASVREANWTIDPVPADLQDRRVEITGPTERKMVINALNSGANVFMADFEDANTPAWQNVVEGQLNLIDAVRGTIAYRSPEGQEYRLKDRVATILVRPRGWHLPEKHVRVDGMAASGSLVDFGLYFFHNARERIARATGPYFYLPKMESHREARLWNDVFQFAEDSLGIARGSTKATVLIETIPAAFQMDEILFELREHSAGLNAGRWDYLFSIIKTFRTRRDLVLPDRAQLTMTVPFMRAYTELLVKTCHRRGAHAIGGMAAFIPSRRDPKVNALALAKVREDKVREANDGFDGTWVAHPDLVPVAKTVFDSVLGTRPNQLERRRDEVRVERNELLDFRVPGGRVTDGGVRANVRVAIQYLESWLRGLGAVAIANLMEDTATAEIARSQVWQWSHNGVSLDDGSRVTPDLVRRIEHEELASIRDSIGHEAFVQSRYEAARRLFDEVALNDAFVEFLTLPAYDRVD